MIFNKLKKIIDVDNDYGLCEIYSFTNNEHTTFKLIKNTDKEGCLFINDQKVLDTSLVSLTNIINKFEELTGLQYSKIKEINLIPEINSVLE